MLRSILLTSALAIGLAAPAAASSVCGEEPNIGNAHVKNWCDSKDRDNNRGNQNGGGQNGGQNN
jgi:hypothetical protein